MGRIRAVDVALDHPRHGRAGRLQTAPHLIEHDLRLPREGLPQELARLRVERRQARHEDEPAGHDDRIDRALPAGLQVGRERFYANADPIHRDTLTYQGALMNANPRLLALTRALADPLRLAVLHRLMTGAATVSELMAVVGAEQSRVSNHLALLRERRVVRTSRLVRHESYELREAAG